MAESSNLHDIQDDLDLEQGEAILSRSARAQGTNSESPRALSNIVAILSHHGCPNASELLNLSECGDRPVAFGGFGDIYYGKTKDGMPVAIKCARVNVDEIIESNTLKAVANELHAWSKCRHENVVDLIGLAQFREQLAIVSPWMANRALPHYLVQNPGVDRYKLCLQIASGLAYLHDNNMVHGDVKGWNVLVSEDGVAKLTDLGSTRLKDTSLQFTSGTNATALSLRWAMLNKRHQSFSVVYRRTALRLMFTLLAWRTILVRVSWFLFLALNYHQEVITGKVPYEGQTDYAVCGTVLAKRTLPPRPTDDTLTPGFKGDRIWRHICSCWAFEPSDRPTAGQVCELLRDAGYIYEHSETVMISPLTGLSIPRQIVLEPHWTTSVDYCLPTTLGRGTYKVVSAESGISLNHIIPVPQRYGLAYSDEISIHTMRLAYMNKSGTSISFPEGGVLCANESREGSGLSLSIDPIDAYLGRALWDIIRVLPNKFVIALLGTDLCIGAGSEPFPEIALHRGFSEPANHWRFESVSVGASKPRTIINRFFNHTLFAKGSENVSDRWRIIPAIASAVDIENERGLLVSKFPSEKGDPIVTIPLSPNTTTQWMIWPVPMGRFRTHNMQPYYTISPSDNLALFWGYPASSDAEHCFLQLCSGAEEERNHWSFGVPLV
ncbi:hypothetical protein FS749_008031 [Ceratobasidium sp. UAMH 11750]|nr:hypothetical protein FS749_008031 [Ceratobasidium sp. UAMH 11750]